MEKKAVTMQPPPGLEASPSPVGRDSPQCVDCDKVAPPTGTNYTLISSRFGWRLTRASGSQRKVMQWRCPACYARVREKEGP